MNIEINVRRDDCGSIDMNFYRMHAKRLRREAMSEVGRSIGKSTLAWIRGWRRSGSARLLRPLHFESSAQHS